MNTTSGFFEACIRPHIGTRSIGGKLVLINQARREIWVCGGISGQIWDRLRSGRGLEDIGVELSGKYRVEIQKVSADVHRFAMELAQRGVIDLLENGHPVDAGEPGEAAHNQNGRLYQHALASNVLFRVWLDLLIPCNLRCRHCYLDFSEKEIPAQKELRGYMDQLAEHGCPELVLTGGEIFLRHDLLELIEHAESKGFLFDIYTNGNFINEKMADRLAKHLITTAQISVYGTTAAVHEAITRKSGTFEKSIRAARLLVERKIPVRLQCHIQQDNFEDAFRFPEFAASLGVEYGFDTKLVPNRDGSKEVLSYAVTVQQQAELYRSGLIKRETEFVCTAAVSKARINAHGDIYPCELINTAVVGNLRRDTLADIWASRRRAEMREQILGYKPHRCGGCNHVSDCEPCAAMRGFNQENHMEAPISEACMLTTASLLASGKPMVEAPKSYLAFSGDCVDQIMAGAPGSVSASRLVQIMQARL